MSSINDLYNKFLSMKTAIQNKGGTVTVAHTNPSPDELIAGIGTIPGVVEVSSMPTASSSTYGAIYKYNGTTDVDFVNGKYYMTILSNGVYSWVLVNETDIPESGKAMLIGYVIKSGGVALANQTVTITNISTNDTYTLTTDAYGKFSKQVDAGTYTISVSASISGYTTPTAQTVTVVANQIDYTYMIYVQAVSATFGDNSWATIAQVSQTIASQGMTSSQVYSNYGWQLGDTKSITLSNNETIQVRIIGFNHDTLSSDHSSKAGITLQMVNCLATRYPMNDSSSNAGGWNGSKMRTSTLPTIKALLPSDLQAVIKLVDKKAANGGSSNYSATVTSSDDLFLLCENEIFGSITYAQDGANEGTQYEYWVGKSASDRIKYCDNAGTQTATNWWERSSHSNSTNTFCNVNLYGTAGNSSASLSRGVAFGFCI